MIQHSYNKNAVKKILGSKIFLFAIVFILIFFIIGLGRESYHKYQLTKEINSLRLEIERLDGRNRQLANLMDYFKEESFLEKEARLKLNLKKPGEKVVIISDYFDSKNGLDAATDNGHNLKAGESASEKSTDKQTANYWKWWEYFFQ
ncbi:MAG: septum formation initiator family protein [Patescibacteria group bacterium]|nr:septum formation initiator family protein [Patescibacteria group bacterium]